MPWCSFLQIAWIWTGELPEPEGWEFTQCSFFHLLFLQIFLSPLLGLQFYVYSIPLQSLIADPFNFSPLSPCISFWIVSIPVSPHPLTITLPTLLAVQNSVSCIWPKPHCSFHLVMFKLYPSVSFLVLSSMIVLTTWHILELPGNSFSVKEAMWPPHNDTLWPGIVSWHNCEVFNRVFYHSNRNQSRTSSSYPGNRFLCLLDSWNIATAFKSLSSNWNMICHLCSFAVTFFFLYFPKV